MFLLSRNASYCDSYCGSFLTCLNFREIKETRIFCAIECKIGGRIPDRPEKRHSLEVAQFAAMMSRGYVWLPFLCLVLFVANAGNLTLPYPIPITFSPCRSQLRGFSDFLIRVACALSFEQVVARYIGFRISLTKAIRTPARDEREGEREIDLWTLHGAIPPQ